MTFGQLQHLEEFGAHQLDTQFDRLLLPLLLIDSANLGTFAIGKRGRLIAPGMWPWLYSRGDLTSKQGMSRPRKDTTTQPFSPKALCARGRRGRVLKPLESPQSHLGCWLFSRIATIRREVARPEPLSVWRNSGLPPFFAVSDVGAARLVIGTVRDRGDLIVAVLSRQVDFDVDGLSPRQGTYLQ